jgi:hypothetical protein
MSIHITPLNPSIPVFIVVSRLTTQIMNSDGIALVVFLSIVAGACICGVCGACFVSIVQSSSPPSRRRLRENTKTLAYEVIRTGEISELNAQARDPQINC